MRKTLTRITGCLLAISIATSGGYSADEAPAKAKNLLPNQNFSAIGEGGSGPNAWPKGCPKEWKMGGNCFSKEEGDTMTIAVDESAPFVEGFPAVKVVNVIAGEGKGRFMFCSRPFPIEPGKRYRFSVWLRSDAPMTIGMLIDGGSGELAKKLGKDYRHWFSRPATQAQVCEEWKEFSVIGKVPGPDDAGYIAELHEVWVRLDPQNGTFWVAKASVVALTE